VRAILEDGTGWFNKDGCKRYAGRRENLYHSFGGSWFLETEEGHYQRVDQAQAHSWLVSNGHYPKNLGAETSAAL